MTEHFVCLNDGSRLEIKVSFATLYYMSKTKIDKLTKKKKLTDNETMELAANLIYVILRSNGRTVNFDEALALTPIDTEEIEKMVNEFAGKMEDYKKKEDAKRNMAKNLPK